MPENVDSSINVFLSRTDKYGSKRFEEVADFLNSSNCPVSFNLKDINGEDYILKAFERYQHDQSFPDLADMGFFTEDSVDDWFSLQVFQEYRSKLEMGKDDFLIILTDEWIDNNCFSKYDNNRNIVMRDADWSKYTEVNPKQIIALTIFENIIKILLRLEFNPLIYRYNNILPSKTSKKRIDSEHNDYQASVVVSNYLISFYYSQLRNNRLFNFEINEFKESYNNYLKITFKGNKSNQENRTVEIEAENVDRDLLEKLIKYTVDFIEEGFGENKKDSKANNDAKTQIESKEEIGIKLFKIRIENYKTIVVLEINARITLQSLMMTLYLFYLTKNDGILKRELSHYTNDLIEIYKKIRPGIDQTKAEDSIRSIVSSLPTSSFDSYCSKIKKEFLKALDPRLAKYYYISGEKESKYSILLPKKYRPTHIF